MTAASASAPIVVLHVFGRMNRGGAESRTMEVMRRLDPRRHRLLFCALSGKTGEFDDEIRALGGEVYYSRLGVRFPWRFVRLLRRVRPDVVHSHVHLASGFILLLARIAGVRGRIAHFRSTGDGRSDSPVRRGYRRAMRRLVGRNATRILAVSNAAMASALGNTWTQDPRCRVIPNGVDIETLRLATPYPKAELGLSQHQRIVLVVGRDNPAKNRGGALSIFAVLAAKTPDAMLLFVGADRSETRADLEAVAKGQDLADRVRFLGQRDDLPRLLATADLVLAPSIREGSPGAILEAAALGVPVLASDIPSIEEVADEIPCVHTLPLTAADAVWVTKAVELLDQHAAGGDGAASHLTRRYSLDGSVQAMTEEWDLLGRAGQPT